MMNAEQLLQLLVQMSNSASEADGMGQCYMDKGMYELVYKILTEGLPQWTLAHGAYEGSTLILPGWGYLAEGDGQYWFDADPEAG